MDGELGYKDLLNKMNQTINMVTTYVVTDNNDFFPADTNKKYKEQIRRAITVCVSDSIYEKLFSCLKIMNQNLEDNFQSVMNEITNTGGLTSDIIGLKSDYYCVDYLSSAISTFKQISIRTSPLAKYECIKEVYQLLTQSVSDMIVDNRKSYYGDDCMKFN